MEESALKEKVREGFDKKVIAPDGHSLFPASFYDHVFDVEGMGLVRTFISDGTHKGTIFKDGEPVKELRNVVYNLSFLEELARMAGIAPSTMGGRGFAAQDLCERLHEWATT